MTNRARIAGIFAACAVAICARDVYAHQFEIGISLEPQFAALPAIASETSQRTLALCAGGGLSVELSLLHDLVVVVRGGYLQAFGDSLIGQASIANREGNYYFQQSAGFALGGLRLQTPTTWLPVVFYVAATGGVSILAQTNRDLRNTEGRSYGLKLDAVTRVAPTFNGSVGMSVRVHHQVRINLEPSLYVLFLGQPALGFGITLGVSFLFFP